MSMTPPSQQGPLIALWPTRCCPGRRRGEPGPADLHRGRSQQPVPDSLFLRDVVFVEDVPFERNGREPGPRLQHAVLIRSEYAVRAGIAALGEECAQATITDETHPVRWKETHLHHAKESFDAVILASDKSDPPQTIARRGSDTAMLATLTINLDDIDLISFL